MSVLRFPVWWYREGLEEVIAWSWTGLKTRAQSLQIRLWMRSFFRPMFGVQDLWGRGISIVMRFLVLIGRLFFLAFEAFAYAVLILLWCVWPITCVLLLILSFVA